MADDRPGAASTAVRSANWIALAAAIAAISLYPLGMYVLLGLIPWVDVIETHPGWISDAVVFAAAYSVALVAIALALAYALVQYWSWRHGHWQDLKVYELEGGGSDVK